jgi:hypothetical protein
MKNRVRNVVKSMMWPRRSNPRQIDRSIPKFTTSF